MPDESSVDSEPAAKRRKTGGGNPETTKMPLTEQLVDDSNTNLFPEDFNALTTTAFLADTSAWALQRMRPCNGQRPSPPGPWENAVFVVDTWKRGLSFYNEWDSVWIHNWPSATLQLPDDKVTSIRQVMVFSPAGTKAVRAILCGENLDANMTTATELDARNSLFRCNHCVVQFLKNDHIWTLIPPNEKAGVRSWFNCLHCF
ncbi:hypothetical protein C8F04DRAFT_1226916 [Mycena alexandri]|uniref:Uncharacterized protein n=1 Tax=Mycena alexandri TaxID=1745969 RepID=A0AAD6TIB2_9AGAR|nr:hypothetical protein C8F04DRAFT_1226916 [Mycena alexandri]